MRIPTISSLPALLIALLTLFAGPSLGAERYVIEMILFERPSGGANEFWPPEPGSPDPQRARAALSVSALPASARRLGPVAYTLRRRGMIVHQHIAWSQVPGQRNSAASWRWMDAGRLRGLIRVTRGRFLHFDTDLLLQDGASPAVYRIRLNRRLRSNELHYVDHPRLAAIIRATRVDAPPTESDAPDPDAGEPKPATPAGRSMPSS